MRINVYGRPGEDDEFGPKRPGWFDSSKATWHREDTYWDGSNIRGVMSKLQAGYEGLYRTAQGRWVLHYDGRNEYNGPMYYEFITDEQARDWLLANGSDDLVERYFGEIEEERGPGRPGIGPAVNMCFPQDVLDKATVLAEAEGISRAEKIRQLVAAGLALAGTVA